MRIRDEAIIPDGEQPKTGLGCPRRFRWREQSWRVGEIQDIWLEAGAWWLHTDEDLLAEQRCWRVLISNGLSQLVVVLVNSGRKWWLRAVMD